MGVLKGSTGLTNGNRIGQTMSRQGQIWSVGSIQNQQAAPSRYNPPVT
jgi:hypothetical protein